MRKAYFRFYPRNWQAATRCLTPLARSVWFEMSIAMQEAEPCGFFVGPSGEPINIRTFARDNNFKPADVRKAIAEIQSKNVCSTDSFGRIFCRFIVYENARTEQDRSNGLLGGNPLLATTRDNPSDNPHGLTRTDNPGGLPQCQIQKQRSDSDSLRSSALDFGDWPSENEGLRRLALVFLAAFGNVFDPAKVGKHLPAYMQVLAEMRVQGVSIAEAWKSCTDARDANGDKPLFSSTIRMAKSFMPPRFARGKKPVSADVEGL